MLPDIRVTCSFCGHNFVCQPDDLIGWDEDVAIYACPSCEASRLTPDAADDGDAPAETELSNDELDTDYEVWANQ